MGYSAAMGDHLDIDTATRLAPEQMIGLALTAARDGPAALETALAALPAPIYTVDADGYVTFFNQACIGFAGRTPETGKDRWCVSWKLHGTDGTPIAHEDCPMAVAVRERRAIRGVVAVAERPDGTRVLFAPYPTPLTGADGASAGAVNILIDVTDSRQAGELRAQAMRCRRLARAVTDARALDTLLVMAEEYDAKARGLDRSLAGA